jgi:hypothetical protein
MTDAPLRLRPSVIAGQTAPDDYSVFTEDERKVGRLYRDEGARNEKWCWFARSQSNRPGLKP